MIRFLRPAGGDRRRRLAVWAGACAVSLLVALGVFASNGWLPRTDAFTGEKTGWFGRKLPKNHTGSAWNPLPPPSPTPQLSKEYIYAGSRLLAVEDANAQAAPPADIAVWRGSNGNWMVMGQTGSQPVTFNWGGSWLNDTPLVGDYDGDGKTDFAVFRPGTESIFWGAASGGGWWAYHWALQGDIPAAADFDGDGKTDYITFRPSNGLWSVLRGDLTNWLGYMGQAGDIPAPADYTGDGRADLATYRPSNGVFTIYDLATGQWAVHSLPSGITCTFAYQCVVPADYDGEGRADPAVFNASNAQWTIISSTTGNSSTTTWGTAGASGCTGGNCAGIVPVHNDYDGDGRADLAVWDNAASASWKIRRSSDGSTRTETFGTTGDIPVPAFYRR